MAATKGSGSPHARACARQSGIAKLEVVFAFAVVLALAAVVVPVVGEARRDSEASQIVEASERLADACRQFHRGTGRLAGDLAELREVCEPRSEPAPATMAVARPLMLDRLGIRPVILYSRLDALGGFVFDDPVRPAASGDGNCARFRSVPERVAKVVDAIVDPDDADDWNRKGRVKWAAGDLDVMLYAPQLQGL